MGIRAFGSGGAGTVAPVGNEATAAVLGTNALSDHFDGAAFNARWTVVGATIGKSMATLVGNAQSIEAAFAPAGDFRIEACVWTPSWLNDSNSILRFGVRDAATANTDELWIDLGAGTQADVRSIRNGVQQAAVTAGQLGAGFRVYLRIDRVVNTFNYFFSVDRTSWYACGVAAQVIAISNVRILTGGANAHFAVDFVDVVSQA